MFLDCNHKNNFTRVIGFYAKTLNREVMKNNIMLTNFKQSSSDVQNFEPLIEKLFFL